MNFKDALTQALDYVEESPALATQVETRSEVKGATNWLKKFCAKAKIAKFKTDATYIRLAALLRTKKTTEIRNAGKVLGYKITLGKRPNFDKIALKAMEDGIAGKLHRELNKSPKDHLRDDFLALAALPEKQIFSAVKKAITKRNAAAYAKAVGFEVAQKTMKSGKNKGKKVYDDQTTAENAFEALKPYIDSMRDAR